MITINLAPIEQIKKYADPFREYLKDEYKSVDFDDFKNISVDWVDYEKVSTELSESFCIPRGLLTYKYPGYSNSDKIKTIFICNKLKKYKKIYDEVINFDSSRFTPELILLNLLEVNNIRLFDSGLIIKSGIMTLTDDSCTNIFHQLRCLATEIRRKTLCQYWVDITTSPFSVKQDDIVEILVHCGCYVNDLFFPGLCNNLYNSGFYAPFNENIHLSDCEVGNSLLLLKDLYILKNSGVIGVLQSIHDKNEPEIAMKVEMCLMAWYRLLYYSLKSIQEKKMIEFSKSWGETQ